MNDDWLDTGSASWDHGEKPPERTTELALLAPPVAVIPRELAELRATMEATWKQLTQAQQQYINAWQECNFNDRKTCRVLQMPRHKLRAWRSKEVFNTARQIIESSNAAEVLKPDKLLIRHDEIIEDLLTPKPILHQGVATGHFETKAGAAAKANETLMRAAGMLKDKEVDINVGIVGPSFTIQVVQPDNTVIDVTPKGVKVELPEPSEEDWLNAT